MSKIDPSLEKLASRAVMEVLDLAKSVVDRKFELIQRNLEAREILNPEAKYTLGEFYAFIKDAMKEYDAQLEAVRERARVTWYENR